MDMVYNYYSNGDIYEGEWKNCLPEGYGIYHYHVNGDRYEGEWKHDKKEGLGIYYKPKEIRYKGEWKNSLLDGYECIIINSLD